MDWLRELNEDRTAVRALLAVAVVIVLFVAVTEIHWPWQERCDAECQAVVDDFAEEWNRTHPFEPFIVDDRCIDNILAGKECR